MASLNIQTNLPIVLGDVNKAIQEVLNKEFIPRIVANGLLDIVPYRIHIEGKGSSGAVIGPYSPGYYKKRQMKPYNRDKQPNVIVSLTRQLENDWSVLETENGYGLGFKNPFNKQKLNYVEHIRQVTIGELTPTEVQYITDTVQEEITNAFK